MEILLEIRPGVGGEDAKVFASELRNMYMKVSNKKGYICEIISDNEILISGRDCL